MQRKNDRQKKNISMDGVGDQNQQPWHELKMACSVISDSIGVGKPMILAATCEISEKPATVTHRKSQIDCSKL